MKTSAFVGISLDGFLARVSGAYDFLTTALDPDGEFNGYHAFFATVDVVILGRNTYEVVLPFPMWPYGTTPVFVLSSRSLVPPRPTAIVEPIAGTPQEVLSQLASRGFRHAYVDGGITIQQFLRAGLLHRLIITRVPILVGSGIPLFGPIDADIPLLHVATRELRGGAVQSEYRIEPPPHS